MYASAARADEILSVAVQAVRLDQPGMAEALNGLSVPIYTTDADGLVTFGNEACARFAGRRPVAGKDRWCVTWKLYTTEGRPLPHDQCPMALAIRTGREIRGAEAIAERPDGTRRRFRPYPTPLLDNDGNVIGAVNMLIDIGADGEECDRLAAQAQRCRRLAKSISDGSTARTLELMAGEYEAKARDLRLPN